MPDHSQNRVTVWLADDVQEAMDDEYIDWRYESRSQWVREAIQFRMALQDALDRRDIELPEDDDERKAMIEDIATAGVATFASGDSDESD